MGDADSRIEALIPQLRRFARALARDADAADDLVQDCLERALGAWRLRRAEGDLRAWLFAILFNLHTSGIRRRARRRRLLEAFAWALPCATQGGEGDTAVYAGQILHQLDSLPEEQRAVLLLIGVEGIGYEEAARVLGVPLGTVMSRLSRGRERLRREAEAFPTGRVLRLVERAP